MHSEKRNSDPLVKEFLKDKKGKHRGAGKKKHHGRHGNPDLNNDGVIDKAEFNERAFKRFERLDVNNDDVVSSDERKAARSHHKNHDGKRKAE